ncbi:MAG: type VI secretion system protein TssA [Pseudomonadota bacterium]
MINVDQMLLTDPGDEPSGPDLQYDPDFMELLRDVTPQTEGAIQGTPQDQKEPPSPAKIMERAEALLWKAHDLRIAIIWANAALRDQGLPGLASGLELMAGMVEQHWDTFHPELDADDDNDPTARTMAARDLIVPDAHLVMHALHRTALTASALGGFTLRDIEFADGTVKPPEGMEVVDEATIKSAFSDTSADFLVTQRDAAATALAHAKALAKSFDDRIGSLGPDLVPLQKRLFAIHAILAKRAEDALAAGGTGDEDGDGDGDGAGGGGGDGGEDGGGAISGRVRSRDDVVEMLGLIEDYYRKQEPSSPVPILLRRASRLVKADFLTILQDMAPDGVDQAKHIGGIRDDEED